MAYPVIKDGPITYRAYTELPLIVAFSEDWDTLLRSTACNRAFSSACWFLSICKADPCLVPCVIAAWHGRQLAGVLPLVYMIGTESLEFSPFFSDYNDIIARPGDPFVTEGLLDCALGLGKTLCLKDLRLDSNCYRAVAHARPDLAERQFQVERNCLYITLDSTYHGYLASRSRSLRAELWRNERKARRDGLTVMALSPESFSPELLPEVFLSISLGRFREKSAFCEAKAQSFVRAAFPELFRQGRLKPFALIAGGQVIAINICMAGPDGLCIWNGGFLPEAEEYSPGKLLLAEQLRQSFALGMEEYDMLRGAHSYKARWATGSRSIGRFDLEPGTALLPERCIAAGAND
jgi:CelD/BcsL family acetyltransferase involved in cellulose biosynthesis